MQKKISKNGVLIVLCGLCFLLVGARSSVTTIHQGNLSPTPAPQSDPDVDNCFRIVDQVIDAFGYEGVHRVRESSLQKPTAGVDYYCYALAYTKEPTTNNAITGMNIQITKFDPSPDTTCDMSQYLSTNPNVTTTLTTFHDYNAVRGNYSVEGNDKTGENQSISWCMYKQGSAYTVYLRTFSNNISQYGYAQDPLPVAEMVLSLMVFDQEPTNIGNNPSADTSASPIPSDITVDSDRSGDPSESTSLRDFSAIEKVLSSPAGKIVGTGMLILAGAAIAAGLIVAMVKVVPHYKKSRIPKVPAERIQPAAFMGQYTPQSQFTGPSGNDGAPSVPPPVSLVPPEESGEQKFPQSTSADDSGVISPELDSAIPQASYARPPQNPTPPLMSQPIQPPQTPPLIPPGIVPPPIKRSRDKE